MVVNVRPPLAGRLERDLIIEWYKAYESQDRLCSTHLVNLEFRIAFSLARKSLSAKF